MPESAATETLAVRRRRESRREERAEHVKLAALLNEYLDVSRAFWSPLENKPRSPISGMHQRMIGCRSGLPDIFVLLRRAGGTCVIFVEMKSIRGRMSPAQKQVRAELLPTGAKYYMARTAVAALAALKRERVPFRKPWTPPEIEDWAGPFSDISRKLPAHPAVSEERREEKRRYRLRRAMRARKATKLAAERDDAAGDDIAA
jgi:hypothetical protein